MSTVFSTWEFNCEKSCEQLYSHLGAFQSGGAGSVLSVESLHNSIHLYFLSILARALTRCVCLARSFIAKLMANTIAHPLHGHSSSGASTRWHHNLSRIPACEDSGMRAMTASTRVLSRLRSPAECPSSTARDSDSSDFFTKLSSSSSSATRSFAASVASFACASSAPARARSAAVSASICACMHRAARECRRG